MQQFHTPEVLEQINDLHKLTTQITQRTQSCTLDIINECVSSNNKHLEHWEKIKNPEELLALQKRLINENGERAINVSKKMFNTLIANMDDINQLSVKWVEGCSHMFNPLKLWAKSTAEQNPSATSTGKRSQ